MLSKRRPSRSSRHLNLKSQSRKLITTKSSDSNTQPSQTNNPYGFRKNLLKTKKQNKKEEIVEQSLYITNKQLFRSISQFQFRQGVSISDSKISEQKKPIILSYIQEFSQHYSKVLKEVATFMHKVRWVLISKAVNSLQLQNQFNRRYQNFSFEILPSVYAVVNKLNFNHLEGYLAVSFGWFGEIRNLQAFENGNPAILEQKLEELADIQPQQKDLWLINDSKVQLLPKSFNFLYYYLDEFSIEQGALKVVPPNTKLVYILLVNSNKATALLSQVDDNVSEQKLKKNLLRCRHFKYIEKLSQSLLHNKQIYCLINFPTHLVEKYAQSVQLLMTSKQKLQVPNIKINFIYYAEVAYQDFMSVRFDKNALDQDQELERTIKECRSKNRLFNLYKGLTNNISQLRIFIFHSAANQALHKQLQYLLASNIEIVEDIQYFFKIKEDRKLLIIGKFSKIQAASLESVDSLRLINLKEVQSDLQSKHQKIIIQITKIINKQDKRQILFQYQGQGKYIRHQIFSDINQYLEEDGFFSFDEQTRCYSTPNLRQMHNEVYILVPKTVPWHSLLNRSMNPYNLLVYSSFEEVRQLTNYLDMNSYAAVIAASKEKPSFLQKIHRQNFDCFLLEEISQRNVRDCIDKVIEKECLALKKGSISKYKKGMPALVLFDEKSSQHVKFISLMNKIFKQNKIITMSKVQFYALTAKFKICQLVIYELGKLQFINSIRITNPLNLFNVYMSPLHSGLQLSCEQLIFSNRMFWIKHWKQKVKKDKIRGRLNDVNMNRVQSPRSKSLKNIQFYSSEKGITFMHNQIQISKVLKAKRFESKNELLGLLFTELNKGNHVLVVLNEKEYEQMQQLSQTKAEGIIWVIIVKNQNYCIIRQPKVVFCLPQHLQSVIISITQKFRRVKNKEFKQTPVFNAAQIYSESNQEVKVHFYEKWNDYILTRETCDISEAINLINPTELCQIDVKQIRNTFFSNKNVQTSSLLSKLVKMDYKNVQSSSQHQSYMIVILIHLHNIQFISQCLKILGEESNCLLVAYQRIEDVLLYTQLSKTIVIIEQNEEITLGVCLHLAQKDTPFGFSSKLGAFLQSVRKST